MLGKVLSRLIGNSVETNHINHGNSVETNHINRGMPQKWSATLV